MKNLYKIFFSAAVALATMVGCTESSIEELTVNPDSELTGTFRVAATTPTNEATKVDVDGLSVSWSDTDVIKIVRVGDDGQFVTSYTYRIDEESISDSGKYAEFTGSNLTAGQRYIAYNYPSGGSIASVSLLDITANFYCFYSYDTFDKDDIDIVMQSNIFEYDGVSLPQLSFEHKSSILELDIQLSNSSTYICDVTSIEIAASSGKNIFLSSLLFNSYGESVYASSDNYVSQYGATNSIELVLTDAIELSVSSPISMQVPLTWNGYITQANGEFEFTIKTSDGAESSVTKPIQVLEDGVRYSAELIFDEPQDMIANDRAALIDLYNSTDGDNWTDNTNWCTDADLSEWYGVTVSNSRVTQINLYNNNLSGSIPESIGALTSMHSLNLGYNALTGSIPESIGNLTEAQTLYLSYNYLSGSIPESIGDMNALRYLYLSYNTSLTGSIPESLWGLSNLQYINLSYNIGLTGSISESIGNLTSLWYLNLSYNQLSGSLPTAMSKLSNLQSVYLKYNNFTGTVPSMFETQFDWNEVAWNVVVQNDGYGFSSFPDVYLESSTVTTIENQTINTQEYFGSNKLTCVLLWRSWCGYSTYYMSTIKDLYNTYSSEGFGFISLNDESDLSTITSYVSSNSIPGHVCQLSGYDYSDGTNRIKYMPTSSSPTYAFVDSDGKIVFSEGIYQIDNLSYYSRSTETKSFVEGYFGSTTTEDSESTDYSKDGEVVTLQTATVGNGIDIVIVGDGFVDTDMEIGGVYETRMSEAMEHFFSEEPYTTYRDRYNVYAVKAVSKNSGVDGVNDTVFSCQFGEGTLISGDNTTVFAYALKVPSITTTNNLTVIAVLNASNYAGTCYMYSGNDASIAYCPIIYNTDENFRQIIIHEAGGHGFAKLLDEYAYTGTISDDRVAYFNNYEKVWGWGANVDVVSNPSTIQWADLLADSRYSGLVGIYEGSMTYEYGAYRPTDVSIMKYNTGGYNPPSRKEIYRRIMVLSGDTYDYEEFVSYDAINRSVSSQAYSASQAANVDKSTFVPFAQPVVINGSPEVGK